MNYRVVFGTATDDATRVEMLFAGAGSAFCVNPRSGNWQSNVLLTVTSDQGVTKSLLIDCGGDVRHALAELGKSHRDVDAVYVSHPHADHVGGLEWLAFLGKFDPGYVRPAIVGNHRVLRNVWEYSISGGLRSIEGEDVHLESFFDSHYLGENQHFIFNGLKCDLLNVVHIMDNREIVPTYGLLLHMPGGKQVFFTTDTQHSPKQIGHFYKRADTIFQDCETGYAGLAQREPDFDQPFKSGVHAHLEELDGLPDDQKAKMHLYHYQDGTLDQNRVVPEGAMSPVEARADEMGFRGFVRKGNLYFWESGQTNA